MKKEKKKYAKPVVKKNEPLVNITFASPLSPTPGGGSPVGSGGSPAPVFG